MGISQHPSHLTMPVCEPPYPSILDFLSHQFPYISPAEWEQRIMEGKVLDGESQPITLSTPYMPRRRLYYFREVHNEAAIPFAEEIIFQNQDLLVACKPHFLPVTPAGHYVDQCLLNRLRKSTGIQDLAPLHRIDRQTAGLVMFSTNKSSCARYSELFKNNRIEKSYEAISAFIPATGKNEWVVENRLEQGIPWFRMATAAGAVNASSVITFVEAAESRARFSLRPITGKTHQLRIHMCSLGFGILNDNLYPQLQPEKEDNFDAPLQLLARMIRFKDPITGVFREFVSQRKLIW